MWSVIEYLKRPELVVTVQEWFGIEYLSNDGKNVNRKNYDSNITTQDQENIDNSDKTSCLTNKKEMHRRNYSCDTENRCAKGPGDSEETKNSGYRITNRFWYYLFVIGTELGDEIFYATMIPFWFWNIDSAVGRRVVCIWSIVMYIGQMLKDIIRWPRPGFPVIRLQNKWSVEYGMPSTHAMVSIVLPFSVVFFMMDRYQFSITIGFMLATAWCLVVSISRLYLGMHSVADVIAGLILTIFLMVPLVPIVNRLDHIILSAKYSPIFVIAISILLIIYYPRSDKWTPTRGDTTMTTSVTTGILVAAWLNYQLGLLQPPDISSSRPYQIIWPTYHMIGLIILRTIIGLCVVIATRAVGKSIAYAFVCMLLGRDKNEIKASESTLENRDKIIVELCYKFFVCSMIGFNTNYLLPNVFKMLNIGRPDFYTEI